MIKDEFGDSITHLKSKEEVLEISSTGYGLESVSKDSIKKQKSQKVNKINSSGCGGL
jgi:hypothetical protein